MVVLPPLCPKFADHSFFSKFYTDQEYYQGSGSKTNRTRDIVFRRLPLLFGNNFIFLNFRWKEAHVCLKKLLLIKNPVATFNIA